MSSKQELSRSEQRKREFQKRIMDAAVELFGEQDIEDTPITAIIQKAGIAHKTFFNHFPSKTHLVSHIAKIYSGYSSYIFRDNMSLDCSAQEKLARSFMGVAEGLIGLEDNDLKMFKHVLNGVTLGPESSKVHQLQKISASISAILNEARDNDELQPGLPLEQYIDNVSMLFISTLLTWASDPSVSLIPKMRRTLEFIDHSVFK